MVALGAPPTGTQYQINLSVPLAYQAAPVDVQASGVVPGSVQVLIDGKPVYHFPGAGGEWMWPLAVGTHHIQAVARDLQGHMVRSEVSIVQVIKPQAPL
jgi:allophanate hydrolase subunit 2